MRANGSVGVIVSVRHPDYFAGCGGRRFRSDASGQRFERADICNGGAGDRTRLFIAERAGDIKILNLTTGLVESTPFLSIPNVDIEGEGGFLGMAFHPDYASNGKFYVNVTVDNGGPDV